MFRAAFTSALPAKPQAVHAKRAWLSRDFASTCPHAEHRWLVNAGLIFSTRPGALSCRRRTSRPHPWSEDRPVEAGLLAHVPARASQRSPSRARHVRDVQVLDPDHVEPARDAGAGLLGPVLAPVRLAGLQPGDRVLDPPAAVRAALARASLRCSRRSRARSAPLSPGTRSSSPVDRAADTATPRSMPTVWPLPGAGTGSGTAANATCQRPGPVPGHPVGLHSRRHRAGPAEPYPSGLRHPHLAHVAGQPPHIAGLERDDPEPSFRPALRHDGPADACRRSSSPWPGRSRAAPAAAPSGSLRPATGAPPARR